MEEKVNRAGFVDRPLPEPQKPDDVCRVIFIGDSFVEALQVSNQEKSHVVFETLANQLPLQKQVETVAFGRSGTGQINQLIFYDEFAKTLDPDAVILIVVANDFANNSHVLEAVRNGWHPRHLPMLYATHDQDTGDMQYLPIDPHWEQYLLPLPAQPAQPKNVVQAAHATLGRNSRFHGWLSAKLNLLQPSMANYLNGAPLSLSDIYVSRMAHIQAIPEFNQVFREWSYPADWGIDQMFYVSAATLPPVFTQALTYTRFAFSEFTRRAQSDQFQLIVFADSYVSSFSGRGTTGEIRHPQSGRSIEDGNYVRHLGAILDDYNIPLIEFFDYHQTHGLEVTESIFAHDGHWTATGHRRAAQALLAYFTEQETFCAD